jgi:hypothetical protein
MVGKGYPEGGQSEAPAASTLIRAIGCLCCSTSARIVVRPLSSWSHKPRARVLQQQVAGPRLLRP